MKKQAVASSVGLPQDVLTFQKTPTDLHDDLIRVIPSQTSPITVTSSLQKITVDFPNTKTIRMNNMILEMVVTPSFTTTASDTWSSLTPSFVPLMPSLISRWTMFIGSATLCDNYTNDLRWNLQYWMRSNAISRNDDEYFYPTALAPASAGGTAGVATTVRFPLVYDPNDFGNLRSGVLPLGILPRMKIDLYFNPAANVLSYPGSAGGTITFSYVISNLQFWVEECSSDLIAASIAQKG